MVYSDRSELGLSDETIRIFKIYLSVKKTAENYRNGFVSEKRIASKLYKILIPNLITQMEEL